MGNCLVMQEKVIKVMKRDGKILEYKAPMKVHQVLSEFAGHAISETFPVVRHLWPETEMVGGHLYYLLPLLPVPPPAAEKKRVRFADIPEAEAGHQGSGVVRIKMVISKQELEVMLRRGGVLTVDDMVSLLQKNQRTNRNDKFDEVDGDGDGDGDDGNRSNKEWKPVLESIPEVY